jgi:hypothetical protein
MLGSMTKLFNKNLARSTDLLFLKSLTGSNSVLRAEQLQHQVSHGTVHSQQNTLMNSLLTFVRRSLPPGAPSP